MNKSVSGNVSVLRTQTDNQFVSSAQSSNTTQSDCCSDKFYLTIDQYTKFLNLINKRQGTAEVSTNIAGICCNSYVNNNKWVIDSAAIQHMTNNDYFLKNKVEYASI